MLAGKLTERLLIGGRERLQMAHDQSHVFRQVHTLDCGLGVLADGHLDLRHREPAIASGQKFAQWRNQPRHPGIQDCAVIHLRDEGTVLLAKADEHRFLLDDIAHGEARLASIADALAAQRGQVFILLQTADVLHLLVQHALLELDLRIRVQVLHGAAAADAGVGTRRLHALRCRDQDGLGAQFIILLVTSHVARTGGLAGQRTIDEGDLAIDARDPAPVMAQALHLQLHSLGGKFVATSCTAHEVYLLLQGTHAGGAVSADCPGACARMEKSGKDAC